jgi:hypothetical protein
MLRWVSVVGVLALSGCRGDPLGKPCAVDDDCGPGFDCFRDACVQVCTTDDECRDGQTCYRYHCIVPGQEHARRVRQTGTAPEEPRATSTRRVPPTPDATAAELRAIRRELELLRRDQARLIQLLEEKTAPPKKRAP